MSRQRIPSLDGLRAISIVLVILSHLAELKHGPLARAGNYGSTGVHVFFVLSGFLITSLLLREYKRTSTISLQDFYIRRAFRIFPAALVFLAVVVPLYWHQMRWYHVAAAVFYVANMDFTRPWIFGHLWSLAIEEQFYLLWPFALKKWERHKVPILLCVFAIAPVFRTILYFLKIHDGLLGSLPAYANQLAIGCLLAIFASRLPKIRGSWALLMLLFVIAYSWLSDDSPHRILFLQFVLKPLLDVAIAGLVLHVIQVPYRILNWGPVVRLGKISYSLYLWQELFCANPSMHGVIWVLPALGCAALSYYLVEQPMLRLRDKLSGSRSPAQVLGGPARSTPDSAVPTRSLPIAESPARSAQLFRNNPAG